MCPSGNHDHSVSASVPDAPAKFVQASDSLIADLVSANHILSDQGVVDAFGHVSHRHDTHPDLFLMARNMAPGQVTAGDLVTFSLDGSPIDAGGRAVYLERFIHAEIFRRRPDVRAVVHSHSHAIVPFSVSKDTTLQALFHMAGFIGGGAPVFEIRDYAGDSSDLLIRDSHLGRALAEMFDGNDIVLMRGHGSTVCAGSIRQAVYRAVYAELNARYQLDAMRLGEITVLTAGECRTASEVIEKQVERPWELWVEQACRRRIDVVSAK